MNGPTSGAGDTSRTGDLTTPRSPRSFQDPVALMKIRSLELRARSVVEGFMNGLHRSPYHGFSVEFTEYRQYVPGDDLRYLDWRRYARTDREYIKRFEDETNLRAWLLVDFSKSMNHGTVGYTKADYARTVAATLATFLARQRDATGLITFDSQIQDVLPARFRPGHLHRLMMCLERAATGTETSLTVPLDQVSRLATRRGLVMLLSDLLTPLDDLERNLGYVRSRGHEVMVLRILDPSEVTFEFKSAAMFRDVETGKELFVDPDAVRSTYLKNFREHAAGLEAICQRQGIAIHQLRTDQPVENALFNLLSLRQQGGRSPRRARNPSGSVSPGGRT